MTLILLAISLSIAACVIAYNCAIYALPVMVAIFAVQCAWHAGAGVILSGVAAIGAALLSVALVIAALAFARNSALRLVVVAVFAVPAAVAGFALVHGIAGNAIEAGLVLDLLGGIGGLVIGVAAMLNLNALGQSILLR